MDEHRGASDECLMRRYVDGDSGAFDELFMRYEQRAYAFFLRRVRSEDRAEDLYQELFLRIHRARGSYDPQRPFAPWFYRIAARLVVDDLRRAFRHHEVALSDEGAPSVGCDAEQQIDQERQAARVLEQLTPEEQRVLVAAKVAGVSYAELAREMGKSADAVKKLASRAMQRLRAAASADAMSLAVAGATGRASDTAG